LEREIQIFREDTTSNNNSEVSSGAALLAIGFIGHSLCPKQFEQQVLQKHRPDVVQFFAPAVIHNFGTNNNIAIAKSYGAKVMAQIGTASEAQEAMDAGVDIIICQGSPEAGGHGVRLELGTGTLSLTSHVVSMVQQQASPPPVVLAAGGIVDGRGLAAALALGCDGVAIGTRLWASTEARGSASLKQALVDAQSPDDVVRSIVFDTIANTYSSTPWPEPFDSSGTLRNNTTKEWEAAEIEESREAALFVTELKAAQYKEATRIGDPTITAVYAGKGVGQIQSIEGAYDIITRMEQEAVEIMDTKLRSLLPSAI